MSVTFVISVSLDVIDAYFGEFCGLSNKFILKDSCLLNLVLEDQLLHLGLLSDTLSLHVVIDKTGRVEVLVVISNLEIWKQKLLGCRLG